ncbi:MAG: HypC/HybG/HupF family hydrogenase formation chaperone [Acidimicrobiales bacterium]
MVGVAGPPLEHAPGLADDLSGAALSLARRFAAGATMWCAAPVWPAHGRHVAVEFVHPVIVGKRALPAVNIGGRDPAGALRLLANAGDVLLAVAPAGEPRARDLLRRSEAWGLCRFWLGAGPRPPGGFAEHVVWLDGPEPAVAARTGDVVMLYHLLWELTHVVFEHPGLLEPEAVCSDEVCTTCADEGTVGEVIEVHDLGRAEVIVGGASQGVDVSLVAPVRRGDLVLVHAGVALTTLVEEPGSAGGERA